MGPAVRQVRRERLSTTTARLDPHDRRRNGTSATRRLACALAAAAVLAQPAAAQQSRDERIAGILDAFLSEERIVLTCSALDAHHHASRLKDWQLFAGKVLALLKGGGVSDLERAEFAAAALPTALMMPDSATFSELRALCTADPGRSRRAGELASHPLYPELTRLLRAPGTDGNKD